MELFFNKLVSSVLEIVLFALIPFVWWLITARKKESFFSWIGLKKIELSKMKVVMTISSIVVLAFLLLSFYMLNVVKGVESAATNEFTGLGIAALPAVVVYALFNTALPEEILFRGFLLKRFNSKFGFTAANMIQCVLFGFMHGIMFFQYVGVLKAAIIIAFTAAVAWCMGYINEKKADGSILPSWGIHAAANIFSGLVAAFMLIS